MPLNTRITRILMNHLFKITFYKNYVVILLELVMFKKINIKAIRDSIALLMIAAVVGTIVSFVAQIFMIGAKNIYNDQYILRRRHLKKSLHLG